MEKFVSGSVLLFCGFVVLFPCVFILMEENGKDTGNVRN